MLVSLSKRGSFQRLLAGALVAIAASVCVPAPASAHFILTTPNATLAQDSLGSPQKAPPCGDEAGSTPSGKVTAYQAGQTITVTINETIFHPGHYRISLGVNGPGDIPVEPIVTPGANTPCGSAPIEAKPTFPVLADGVFEHQAPFNGPQTITLTLPADVTCDHCTLQILEFMSNHPLNNPGGCYYHHCADISIQAATDPDAGVITTATTSATVGSTADSSATSGATGSGGASATGSGGANAGGGSSNNDESSGCGFAGTGSPRSGLAGLAGLVALAAVTRRRRRA